MAVFQADENEEFKVAGGASQASTASLEAGVDLPTPDEQSRDRDLVQFDGDADPTHPLNWSLRKKVLLAIPLAFSTFTVGFNSSLFSAGIKAFSAEFGVSHTVGTLGVSLYVLGFATGPIFWAPYSEIAGRRLPIAIGIFGFSVFSLGVGAGKNTATVMICRFWSGIFGASPMTIVAAVFVDMFNAEQRGPATTIFSINVLMAPMIAPFIGGFIVGSPLGWRWTAWLGAIMGFTALTIVLFLLEETYAPKILESKAQVLRRTTGNWALHSVSEEATLDMRQLLTEYLSRPLRLLFTEPLVFLVSIYLAFIYGLVYLFLTAYPLVFSGVHGMKPGVSGLPYLAMVIGMLIAATYLLLIQPSFKRKMTANHNKVVPEWRLPPAIIGSCTFAAGILMLGWTGYRSNIHWIFPTLSGLLTGFGVMAIFQQLLNYLFDTYFPVAASVNAGASVIRSLFGACFPLFASQMFASLGINYACTVLSGIAALCIPIPVAFYFWGPKLRARAKLGISPKI